MARVSGFHCARAREEIRRHAYSLLQYDFLCVQRIRSRFKDKSLWRMDTKRTGERKKEGGAKCKRQRDRRSIVALTRRASASHDLQERLFVLVR